MNRRTITALALLVSAAVGGAEMSPVLFDPAAIRDATTLETRVVKDWTPAPEDPAIRQKLIEITVCEWWPGQTIRLPVTLNAPASGEVCRNVIVGNMGLVRRPALPTGAARRLLEEHGVGVVLIGTGEIGAMAPGGTLHLEMKERLLETRNLRYTPAWIWGMSHMRALTAAIADASVFQPVKVLATGGSKRGMAAIAAGIHDDRFTAIMPIVAAPLGSPSGPFIVGTGSPTILRVDQEFLAALAAGRFPRAPSTARAALLDRRRRQADVRITVATARAAGWSEAEIVEINDHAWDTIRITSHLPTLRERGLAMLYNVGTNDNASPALIELGRQFPEFPIYIVPGGQHGGPKTTGFTRQVPLLQAVDDNLYSFAQHHFFAARPLVATPVIHHRVDRAGRLLRVTVTFPDGVQPQENELWWSVNRHPPLSLAYEYDVWQPAALRRVGAATYAGEVALPADTHTIDFLTTHRHTAAGLPLSISSPLQRWEAQRGAAAVSTGSRPRAQSKGNRMSESPAMAAPRTSNAERRTSNAERATAKLSRFPLLKDGCTQQNNIRRDSGTGVKVQAGQFS